MEVQAHHPQTLVNSLWIGGPLGPMGQLTIRSFVRQGYGFRLWVYEEPEDLPPSPLLQCADARQVLPEERVFRYERPSYLGHGKHSVAGFSDLFRYVLLERYGGWWTDMDVTCLARLPETQGYCFRTHHKLPAVGNLMHCPPGSPLMAACAEEAVQSVHSGNRDWMLPIKILNKHLERLGLSGAIRDMTNPDSWWSIRRLLDEPAPALPAQWLALHWNNTDWQRLGLSQNEALEGSVYRSLLAEHGINLPALDKAGRQRLKQRLGLAWFAWCSLRNRLSP